MLFLVQISAFFLLIGMFFDLSGKARPCGHMDIRNNISELERLRNCTVILGALQLVLLEKETPASWRPYSFPELREITHNLVVYRVKGLQSLGALFPNLAVIRGYKLLSNYALAVFDSEIREIGLSNLLIILKGSVRIEKNSKLCFASTINWDVIASNGTGNVAHDWNERECPTRTIGCAACPEGFCWNQTTCQNIPQLPVSNSTKQCHPLCLADCTSANSTASCSACRFLRDSENCLLECPNSKFRYEDYFCISERECLSKNLIPFAGICSENCPVYYRKVAPEDGFCEKCTRTSCHVTCGSQMLKDLASIQNVKGCTFINGSLEIRLINSQFLIQELYENLDSLQEVFEGVRIMRSMMQSLDFLKNLKFIHGENTKDAFYVVNNPNLEKLFDWSSTENLTINRGKLIFHFNPKLCLREIEKLRQVSGLNYSYDATEISPVSNGDEMYCGYKKIGTNWTVLTSRSALIQWEPYWPPPTHILLGYEIYFAKMVVHNMTEEAPTLNHIPKNCKEKPWQNRLVLVDKEQRLNVTLTDLEPFSFYGYYISTYLSEVSTKADQIRDVEAQSEMKHFQTFPEVPSRPINVRTVDVSDDRIIVSWDPPCFANGEISQYFIVVRLQPNQNRSVEARNYCSNPIERFNHLESDDETIENCEFEFQTSSGDSFLESHIKYLEQIPDLSPDLGPLRQTFHDLNRTSSDTIYTKSISADMFYHTIRNLLPFRLYSIYLIACNSGFQNSSDLCSSEEFITVRTAARRGADEILYLIQNNETSVHWPEPKRPNSIILTYTIEIIDQSSNITHFECTTRKSHESSNFIYELRNYKSGNYLVRVRATSLAGTGIWTPYLLVLLGPPEHSTDFLYVLFLLPMVSTLLYYIYLRFLAKRKSRFTSPNHAVFCSISPEKIYFLNGRDLQVDQKVLTIKTSTNRTFANVFRGVFNRERVWIKIYETDFKIEKHEHEKLVEQKRLAHHFILAMVTLIMRDQALSVIVEAPDESLKNYLKFCSGTREIIPNRFIFQWMTEIADAMAYLTSLRIVHEDLATRNIFLTSTFVVKVSNFGFGFGMAPEDYFQLETGSERSFPVRWMPKEALDSLKFTHESDVWSFGVTLWEIGMNAVQPYEFLSNQEVIQFVCSGRRLSPPPTLPVVVQKVLTKCLQEEKRRPKFSQIVHLRTFFSKDFEDKSYVLRTLCGLNRQTTAATFEDFAVELDEIVGFQMADAKDTFGITKLDWFQFEQAKLETGQLKLPKISSKYQANEKMEAVSMDQKEDLGSCDPIQRRLSRTFSFNDSESGDEIPLV